MAAPFAAKDIPPALRSWIPASAEFTYPQQGKTSEVAFVNGAGSSIAIKRCTNPTYVEWLQREHTVLNALAGSDLPVPRIEDFAETERDGERQVWLIMSLLKGRSLMSILEASLADRSDLLGRLGELVKRLHGTQLPPGLSAESSWIDRKLIQAERNLGWCDGSSDLLAALHRRRPVSVPEVLIHGDLSLDNVLIADDGALSLVDWSGGDQGDPRCDIALALHTEPEVTLRDGEIEAFFDGYDQKPLDPETRRWFVDLDEFF